MSEYLDSDGKRHTVTEVDSMPYKGQRLRGIGKWEWLRKLVVDRRPGDKPLRIQFDNKHDAELARVAVVKMPSAHNNGHGIKVTRLDDSYIVRTVVQSIDGTKDGEYFLYICVDSR